MKTKSHTSTKPAHSRPNNSDMSFAVGASIAGTALVLLILFSLALCSTKYALKQYYRQGLWQLHSAYQKQFIDLRKELQVMQERIKTLESRGAIPENEGAPKPEIVQ